ncbi:WSSV030 [White spot syndrome virus]|uniref:WSSV030 n=1 Tax=White spot syndrome virus TaxID=342409 RepID=A0A2I6SBH7_9VIRU|nr:WSSV030 [White spot syndrome virus]
MEKAHHMVQTLCSVALNIATKTAVVFVGTKKQFKDHSCRFV